MTYLRYALAILVVIVLVTVAMANRESVTLSLWPDAITAFVGRGYSVTLPLFAVVVLSAGGGLVAGLVWEWLRERGTRAEAARARRAAMAQDGAVGAAPPKPSARDDVLAILDDRSGTGR